MPVTVTVRERLPEKSGTSPYKSGTLSTDGGSYDTRSRIVEPALIHACKRQMDRGLAPPAGTRCSRPVSAAGITVQKLDFATRPESANRRRGVHGRTETLPSLCGSNVSLGL